MDATYLKHRQLIFGALGLLCSAILSNFANGNVLQMFEKDFQEIVKNVSPAVVKIVATEKSAFTRQNIASGIILDADGHVVTTTLEMEAPSKIEVIFDDKRVSSAALIGTDMLTDIAVLRIADTSPDPASSARSLLPKSPNETLRFTPPRQWGNSSKIDTGSWVVTIGSTYGDSPIVSFGIVGGWDTLPNQLHGELIKINAAVTPGNSGGAVISTSGEVVGMILAVLTGANLSRSPIGMLLELQDSQPVFGVRDQEITFAVPIETVRAVAEEIIVHGKVARGWLGIEVDVRESGIHVTNIIEDGPADKGGLLPKDCILAFNEIPLRSYGELLKCIANQRPDTAVKLTVDRNGIKQHCTVILGEKR